MTRLQKGIIRVSQPEQGAIQPFACYFPGGKPDEDKLADGLKFGFYESASNRAVGHVLAASEGPINYVGSTSGPEYSALQPCSFVVGVFDKATCKLQLSPLQGAKVVRLEAKLQFIDYGASGSAIPDAETREQRLLSSKRLIASFGSTRRKRQMTAKEEGVVRIDKLSSTQALTNLLIEASSSAKQLGYTKDQVLQRSNEVRQLPPHHLEATTPEAAYQIDELIPAAAADALDIGRLFKASEQDDVLQRLSQQGTVSSYVLSRVSLLRDPDRDKARRRARLLGFLAGLLHLFKGRPVLRCDPSKGGLDLLAQGLRLQPRLLQELLALFYNHSQEGNQDRYERPSVKQELLLAYIIVVALLVEGGSMSSSQFEALKGELKMSPSDLVLRCREVGATCAQATYVAEQDGERITRRSYAVNLLRDPVNAAKTLGECLPAIRLGRRAGK